jgi:hypothetical protein
MSRVKEKMDCRLSLGMTIIWCNSGDLGGEGNFFSLLEQALLSTWLEPG